MEYLEGKSIENQKDNNYRYSKFNLFIYIFMQNNLYINKYNHGDLHNYNWKITNDNKIVIYDYGLCWELQDDFLLNNLNELIDGLHDYNYDIMYISFYNIIKYNSNIDDINDIEVKVKKQKKMKKYNIEEVLKHKDWIVMEVNNERRVYDLSKWIPQHPGGDKIYNGIEANMYYKDPKKYNKKPYDIFMRNNIHKEKNIFELFFERTHKLVKHIGFLI